MSAEHDLEAEYRMHVGGLAEAVDAYVLRHGLGAAVVSAMLMGIACAAAVQGKLPERSYDDLTDILCRNARNAIRKLALNKERGEPAR